MRRRRCVCVGGGRGAAISGSQRGDEHNNNNDDSSRYKQTMGGLRASIVMQTCLTSHSNSHTAVGGCEVAYHRLYNRPASPLSGL